jgi:uncharacterized protein (DUF58 family)
MHLTFRGLLLILLAAPMIGASTWAPNLKWVALIYILLCLVIYALDWYLARSISRFEIERLHDTKLSLGADNLIKIQIKNLERQASAIWVRDEAPEAFKVDQRILSGQMAARGDWEGGYHVFPTNRGNYRFGNINLRWQGPLKLITRQGKLETETTVKVYPNLLNLRRYDLLLRRNRLQEMGLRHTRMYGEGTEYERLREYLPDDEYRRINWKATARRHFPVTTEFQTERSQNIIAVLDTGRMMRSPVAQISKLDYVVNAVLFLGYVATGKGDKVGLMTFADEVVNYLGPKQGRGQFYRMLELLYAVSPQPVEPNYHRALSYMASKHRKRSLVVIFTDLGSSTGINSLISHTATLSRNNLVLVVTISHPEIHTTARQGISDSLSVYQRAVATQLLDERQIRIDNLRRNGVLTLDVPANELSTAVINQYLELKGKTWL